MRRILELQICETVGQVWRAEKKLAGHILRKKVEP